MQWSEVAQQHLTDLKPVQLSEEVVTKIQHLLDLTNLNKDESDDELALFLEKAITSSGHVAAVCLNPQYVRIATNHFLGSPVKVATVVNFPGGDLILEDVLLEINQAIEDGAKEIDMVFPYQRYLAGERQYTQSFITTCKAACGESVLLKVILETGVLSDPVIIADASYDVLTAGADFIKSSTGMLPQGITFEAAATMLLVVKHLSSQLKRTLGVKISGGIKDLQTAAQYIELADSIMGMNWVNKNTFRIGSSRLIDEIISYQG